MSEAPDPYETIKAAERDLAPPAADQDGLELTGEQSLQTIAVELHRANLLKQQELQMRERELRYQERQTDLVANLLDLLRRAPGSDGSPGIAEAMKDFTSSLIGPLGTLLAEAARPKAPRTESLPGGDPPKLESQKGGIRVEQSPEG